MDASRQADAQNCRISSRTEFKSDPETRNGYFYNINMPLINNSLCTVIRVIRAVLVKNTFCLVLSC